MNQVGKLIKRRHVDHSQVSADRGEIAEIAADMREHGGDYMPRGNWVMLDAKEKATKVEGMLDEAFSDAAIGERMGSSEQLLDVWIGSGQMQPALGPSAQRYEPFVKLHDPLDLWGANVADADVASRLVDADLGSILDLNLLATFAPVRQRTRVLEVGGGYGRTAEAALNVFSGSVAWAMIDGVPASLVYAREYLRRACPDARIGFYYDDDPLDLEVFDCYIAPSWHFERVNGDADYDVCANIESFQEMTQEAVDAYLALFDRVAVDDAAFYMSNAHDYVFTGDWNYPAGWRRLFCANTPRSWTRDHPTEIFRRASGDHAAVNAAIEAGYRHGLPPPA